MMDKAYVVGISGGSGSGKTTLAEAIVSRLGNQACLLSYDRYYCEHHELTFEERTRLDYDSPSAFDAPLMEAHLKALKHGEEVPCPVYDFARYDRCDEVEIVRSRPIIIVEGIMVLVEAALRDLMDLKVFVDVDADERILRRARRDIEERGRSFESVTKQYLTTVKPNHDAFVEPTKDYCDLIVTGGGENLVALEVLTAFLASKLA